MGRCIIQKISVAKTSVLLPDMLDLFYPIGKIFITELNNLTPSDLFGGDWEQQIGVYLKTTDGSDGGVRSGSMELEPATGDTGDYALTSNTNPSHKHIIARAKWVSGSSANGYKAIEPTDASTNHTELTGGDGSHKHSLNSHTHKIKIKTINYFIWKRIA